MKDSTTIRLPWPPSVNGYWQSRIISKGRKQIVIVYVTKRGKQFREDAIAAVVDQFGRRKPLTQRLDVTLTFFPPTRRKYDLDNFNKSTLDALTHAKVWEDDELIDRLVCERGEVVAKQNACVEVTIRKHDAQPLTQSTIDVEQAAAPF